MLQDLSRVGACGRNRKKEEEGKEKNQSLQKKTFKEEAIPWMDTLNETLDDLHEEKMKEKEERKKKKKSKGKGGKK